MDASVIEMNLLSQPSQINALDEGVLRKEKGDDDHHGEKP
jgi:hypothetical protein